MGAYRPGDIRDLCRFVGGPEISAIVGINEQHLERMGSIENTMRAKYEIVEGTRPGGLAVFNVDNPYCEQLAAKTSHVRVVRVGACEHDPPADLRAGSVTVAPKLMKFDVTDGAETVTVRTRMLGRHLLPNFLIAMAIGRELGVDLRAAVTRLGRVEPVDHRLAVSESGGMIVIDDAYSSNVDGARAALSLLQELPAQRRFVVTPGIVELGPVEEERNRELGALAAEVCDILLVVGQSPGRYVREGALAGGMPDDRAVSCTGLGEAQAYLREQMRQGDAVLFENDLPDNYA
jgi:UDP-N-acetylmuramoyl-tripeptide--D-alanyl-D-alanine ligase